jgi:AcrR family transcriptional regulator
MTGDLDGRRLRSERSRAQIVRAMLALLRAGEMHPSAAQVAEAAGVGLRSVFRHFSELDVLYAEISKIVQDEIMPLIASPLEGATWKDRLDRMVTRRADLYERVLPMKVAAGLRRFQSPFLMQEHRTFLKMERSSLIAILPPAKQKDQAFLAALEMSVSFQAWRRLRQDQMLSPKDAERAMRFVVQCLTADA